MSDIINHECGLAFVRLLKPLEFYQEKYGTAFFGIQKLHQMMQKQRNRGQDGVGIATIKLDTQPGNRYISHKRSVAQKALQDVFRQVYSRFNHLTEEQLNDATWLKNNMPYMGEVLLGHLRYATHSEASIEQVHPFHRKSNWINRNLLLAGNFNLTNVDEMFQELVGLGQYPKEKSDTVTVLEKMGHFLDDEVKRLYNWFKSDGHTNEEINKLIFENLDIARLLRRAAKKFDGGYVLAGMIGFGDAFIMRDPNGIRPAFYYQDDEVIAMASERPAIQSVFNVNYKKIKEVKPGHALIIKHNGKVTEERFTDPKEKLSCSFERIYFSRGNDLEIYQERKRLGRSLVDDALNAVDYDFEKTVFSYIPNTAEASFYGLMDGVEKAMIRKKIDDLKGANGSLTSEKIDLILEQRPRIEKLVHKDEKERTFIANKSVRNQMVSHVYDVTYGLIETGVDNLVIVDDSIVRGTTLQKSILSICARLMPKKIVVLSSAPQIRFPDCYGIDMSKMKNFIAFQALVDLLQENNKEHLLEEAYDKCVAHFTSDNSAHKNEVAPLYEHFTYEDISARITKLVKPKGISPELEIIFQPIEGLHAACPNHKGDWYFTGNYPTPGGNRVVNRAFMNYMEKKDVRAY